MSTSLLFTAAFLLGAGPADDVAPPPPRGAIERVVVFADRAEVTRAQAGRCTDGAARVVFGEIPEAADRRTLRGDADAPALAVGVSTSTRALAEARDAQVKALQDELQGQDDKLAELARADEDANARAATAGAYAAYFATLVQEEMRQQKPDVTRWEAVLKGLDGEARTQSDAAVARAAERRRVMRLRERTATRLSRLSPSAAPTRLDATVAVTCAGNAPVQVRLSYVVPGASWAPEYDLRFTRGTGATGKVGDGEAVLTVAGVITQSTGEDWTNAAVALSTAKPALGGEAPLPNPLYVQATPDERQKTLVQAQERRAEALKQGGASSSGAQGAALEDGGKAFVLRLPERVTVRADGRPYWFPVDDIAAKATSQLVAVPALTPYVFQVAKLRNPAAFPLMAGQMHVFRGATFVGTVAQEYRAPGEPLEVSLGIDEEIELDRIDLLKQDREAGVFSGTQSIAQAFRTLLNNRSDGEVTVEVREQIPVSKTADIAVTIDTAKTAPDFKLDKLRGHVTWMARLKRGEKTQRDLAFTIQLPKEWALQ